MVRFIPLSDELIYDHPERIPRDGSARLVPFHLDRIAPPSPAGERARVVEPRPAKRGERHENP